MARRAHDEEDVHTIRRPAPTQNQQCCQVVVFREKCYLMQTGK